jgi:hypothetical protein
MDRRYPRVGGGKYSGPGIRNAFEEHSLEGTNMRLRDCYTDLIMKATNKMQQYRLIDYFESVLHVSGYVYAHHQEYLTVFTASDSVHPNAADWCHG